MARIVSYHNRSTDRNRFGRFMEIILLIPSVAV
jgi:hypothetical protein